MRIIFLFLVLCSRFSFGGTWTVLDGKTLRFDGPLLENDFERFEKVYTKDIESLVVDSGGGDTEVAIKIANKLYGQLQNIVVEGVCASSCANYFFPVAKRKIIRHGIVGYHGNMTACYNNGSFERQMKEQGLPEEAFVALHEKMKKLVPVEKEFFRKVGVSQDLFDVSCTPDKGAGDGRTYDLLLPTGKTFLKYGIDNVSGVQSQEIINKIGRPLRVH